MVRGQPDFGMYAPKSAAASLSDMGELASRLGSIVTYDKRGDVVDFDNFEEPQLKWLTQVSGGCTANLATTRPKTGSQHVTLFAAIANRYAQIYKRQSILASKRIGYELSFDNMLNTLNLEFWTEFFDGATKYTAGIKFDNVLRQLSLYDNTDDYVSYYTLPLLVSPCYNSAKFVIDFETGYYVRLLFGNTEYDISTIPCYSMAFVGAPLVATVITGRARGAPGGSLYIDHFILTQAEP